MHAGICFSQESFVNVWVVRWLHLLHKTLGFSPYPHFLINLKLCTSRLCTKMLSLLYACACGMTHDAYIMSIKWNSISALDNSGLKSVVVWLSIWEVIFWGCLDFRGPLHNWGHRPFWVIGLPGCLHWSQDDIEIFFIFCVVFIFQSYQNFMSVALLNIPKKKWVCHCSAKLLQCRWQ